MSKVGDKQERESNTQTLEGAGATTAHRWFVTVLNAALFFGPSGSPAASDASSSERLFRRVCAASAGRAAPWPPCASITLMFVPHTDNNGRNIWLPPGRRNSAVCLWLLVSRSRSLSAPGAGRFGARGGNPAEAYEEGPRKYRAERMVRNELEGPSPDNASAKC